MTTQCPHGQLARQCPICERDAEIARLTQLAGEWRTIIEMRQELAEMKAERDRLAAEIAWLRELLGDWLDGYDHDAFGEKTEVVKMLVAKDGLLVRATRAALGEEE